MGVRINNMPADHKPFIVVNNVNGVLWYYGSYDTQDRALEVAQAYGMVVVEDE